MITSYYARIAIFATAQLQCNNLFKFRKQSEFQGGQVTEGKASFALCFLLSNKGDKMKVSKPKSRFLNVPEWKDVLKKATTADDKVLVITSEAREADANSEMLEVPVHNRLTGDKMLYDYKSKFADLFEAHNDDTADWIGVKLVPVVPEKQSNFFVKFEIADVKTENVE